MKRCAFLSFVVPLLAHPLVDTDETTQSVKRDTLEITAWGDSYASGVGAGKYFDGRRCLRYDGAYPVGLDADDVGSMIANQGTTILNNVVCSGAKVEEVIKYQFYTEDQSSPQPDWQYYPRTSAGSPTVGTLTVGGDDIDFPGILNNCIVEGFP